MVSASGGFAPPDQGASHPDPLTMGSVPGPRWGHSRQTPIIGPQNHDFTPPPKYFSVVPPTQYCMPEFDGERVQIYKTRNMNFTYI